MELKGKTPLFSAIIGRLHEQHMSPIPFIYAGFTLGLDVYEISSQKVYSSKIYLLGAPKCTNNS